MEFSYPLFLLILLVGQVEGQDGVRRDKYLKRVTSFPSNVKPTMARVVLLGDTNHADKDQKIFRRNYINSLEINRINSKSKQGPIIVLLEGLDSYEVINPYAPINSRNVENFTDSPFLPSILLGGWENIDVHGETRLIIKDLYEIKQKIQMTTQERDETRKQSDSCSWFGDEGEISRQFRDKYWRLGEEIEKLKRTITEIRMKFVEVGIKKREQHMIFTLDYLLEKFPDSQIFVIAGNAHFNKIGFDNSIKKFLYEKKIPFIYYSTKISPSFAKNSVEWDPKTYTKEDVETPVEIKKHNPSFEQYNMRMDHISKHNRLMQEIRSRKNNSGE